MNRTLITSTNPFFLGSKGISLQHNPLLWDVFHTLFKVSVVCKDFSRERTGFLFLSSSSDTVYLSTDLFSGDSPAKRLRTGWIQPTTTKNLALSFGLTTSNCKRFFVTGELRGLAGDALAGIRSSF